MPRPLNLAGSLLVLGTVMAPAAPVKDRSFEAVVRNYDAKANRFTASFVPAEAKPGQTVTFRLTLELAPGFHTYPTTQKDPKATDFVTPIGFPPTGDVIFVGPVTDPKPIIKAEKDLGIKELATLEGKVVWERKAVVSPRAKPGKKTIRLKEFSPQVCDQLGCLITPAGIAVEANMTVLDGPAVPVEERYRTEVEKAAN